MRKIFSSMLAIGAASMLAATPTLAAQGWTGFFAGVGLGYGSGNVDITATPGPAAIDDGAPPDTFLSFSGIGLDGGFASLAVGADVQLGSRFVAGAFFDYDFTRLSAEANGDLGGGFGFDALSAEAGIDNVWSLGARLGFLTSPDALWYVTGGYTRASTDKLTGSISDGADTYSGSLTLPNFSGYFVGGGVESRIWTNTTVKLEYRYSDFAKERVDLSPVDPDVDEYVNVFLQPTLQTIRASVNYRFTP